MSDEAKFLHLMLKAEAMCEIDTEKADYWRGYMRGLRRAHHGEKFGTGVEHEKWSRLVTDTDESRQQMGRGYLDGLAALGE
jgi:hypothetical protein